MRASRHRQRPGGSVVIIAAGAFNKRDRLGNRIRVSYGMDRKLFRSLGGTFDKAIVEDPTNPNIRHTVMLPRITPYFRDLAARWAINKTGGQL
jgi:hypothetical protein